MRDDHFKVVGVSLFDSKSSMVDVCNSQIRRVRGAMMKAAPNRNGKDLETTGKRLLEMSIGCQSVSPWSMTAYWPMFKMMEGDRLKPFPWLIWDCFLLLLRLLRVLLSVLVAMLAFIRRAFFRRWSCQKLMDSNLFKHNTKNASNSPQSQSHCEPRSEVEFMNLIPSY